MKNNKSVALTASTPKDDHEQNSCVSGPSLYWFPVYEGIFEHAPIMGDAVWLFMWLIARTTKDGKGKVLGGVPIRDERAARELRHPVKTIRRWRRTLVEGNYVTTVRTPYGFTYAVLKNRRWKNAPARDLPKRPFSQPESAQSGQSDLPLREVRVPVSGSQSARSGKYKEVITETKQQIDSRRHSAPTTTELLKGGVAPLPKPTPRRTKPTGRAPEHVETQRRLEVEGSDDPPKFREGNFNKFRDCWKSATDRVTRPKPYTKNVEQYQELCRRFGEGAVLDAIDSYVKLHGKSEAARNKFAERDFLFDECEDLIAAEKDGTLEAATEPERLPRLVAPY